MLHWFLYSLDFSSIFSFLLRWQEQTFHSWTSILLKWYARKQKIWAAELEFTNNNRCFHSWSCCRCTSSLSNHSWLRCRAFHKPRILENFTAEPLGEQCSVENWRARLEAACMMTLQLALRDRCSKCRLQPTSAVLKKAFWLRNQLLLLTSFFGE